MDLKFLFTDFSGRIRRRHFWFGSLIMIAVGLLIAMLLSATLGLGLISGAEMAGETITDFDTQMENITQSGWLSLLLFLIFFSPGAALSIKRRHDRGAAGTDVWVFYGLQLLLLLAQVTGLGYTAQELGGLTIATPTTLYKVVSSLMGILGLYLIVVMGFLKGNEGPNAYGPDPKGDA